MRNRRVSPSSMNWLRRHRNYWPAWTPQRGRTRTTRWSRSPISRQIRKQPRRRIRQETLDTLAADIARVGVLQPVVIRPASDWNGYVLVFGERRYRAALQAGMTHLPAIVRRDLSDADVLEMQWQENAQREDIDDIDKAAHLRRLKEARGLTWSQLAETVHLSKRHLLRMQQLSDLPEDVMELVRERQLTPSHVYQLARLHDRASQEKLANQAVAQQWSVQRLAQAICIGGNVPAPASADPEAHPWQALTDLLRARLGSMEGVTQEERTMLRQIVFWPSASRPFRKRKVRNPMSQGDINVTCKSCCLPTNARHVLSG